MKKLLALLLCFALMLTVFSGCSQGGDNNKKDKKDKSESSSKQASTVSTASDELSLDELQALQSGSGSGVKVDNNPTVIGKWVVQIPAIAMKNSIDFTDPDNAIFEEYVDDILKNASAVQYAYYTFEPDGTVKRERNDDGIKKFYGEFVPEYFKRVIKMATEQYGITEDELLAQFGVSSVEQFINLFMDEINKSLDEGNDKLEGPYATGTTTYRTENGRIYFKENSGESPYAYSLMGSKRIVLSDAKGHGNLSEDVMQDIYETQNWGNITLLKIIN